MRKCCIKALGHRTYEYACNHAPLREKKIPYTPRVQVAVRWRLAAEEQRVMVCFKGFQYCGLMFEDLFYLEAWW